MMKIGIIFAMEEELNALKQHLEIKKEYNIFNLKFYEAIYNNITCILVESGIGKVNAARTTQILIDNMKVDYIFNIGVAGGIEESLKVGDVVVGTSLVQHDFDITAFNHDKGYIPNLGVYIGSDEYLIRLTKDIENLKYGVIASGDIFCTDSNMSNKIHNKFDALCVEMEGASIAQVCYLCNIPFLIIRSISDVPNNNNNKVTYEEFLEISSNNVANIMIKLMDNLKKS